MLRQTNEKTRDSTVNRPSHRVTSVHQGCGNLVCLFHTPMSRYTWFWMLDVGRCILRKISRLGLCEMNASVRPDSPCTTILGSVWNFDSFSINSDSGKESGAALLRWVGSCKSPAGSPNWAWGCVDREKGLQYGDSVVIDVSHCVVSYHRFYSTGNFIG